MAEKATIQFNESIFLKFHSKHYFSPSPNLSPIRKHWKKQQSHLTNQFPPNFTQSIYFLKAFILSKHYFFSKPRFVPCMEALEKATIQFKESISLKFPSKHFFSPAHDSSWKHWKGFWRSVIALYCTSSFHLI